MVGSYCSKLWCKLFITISILPPHPTLYLLIDGLNDMVDDVVVYLVRVTGDQERRAQMSSETFFAIKVSVVFVTL